MNPFFQTRFNKLVDSPNQSPVWWHSIPLPDGNRINGSNKDKDLQFKMWQAMQIANDGGLVGKKVLDIGANDGFFTLAAIMAGAQEVTAMDKDWGTWPQNIQYASQVWNVTPEIITADFRTYEFQKRYDVIFFFGVLYHLEDVFTCMKRLRGILEDQGTIYLETQMTGIQSDLPIFEYASDIYPTISRQDKKSLRKVGISNYLFPNEPAIRNLAHSYDFSCEALDARPIREGNPLRQLFRLEMRCIIKHDSQHVIFQHWSYAEPTQRWSLGNESSIVFTASDKSSFTGNLALHIGTLGRQTLIGRLNGVELGRQVVDSRDIVVEFKFDPSALHHDKNNELTFSFPDARKPGGGDNRVLAMALRSLEFL